MLKQLAKAWFGDFSSVELKKFLMLAVILFFTVGVYWPLRLTKDSVFNTLIGLKGYQWVAKLISVLVVFPLVMLYNYLVDTFPRHRLFYVLGTAYAGLMLLSYFVLKGPLHGEANMIASPVQSGWNIPGWVFYVLIESFGSIMVALFWSFSADVATPKSAKSGYFLVAIGGQIGATIGSYMVWKYAKQVGTDMIVLGCALGIMVIPFFVWLMRQIIPKDHMAMYQASESGEKASNEKQKPKSGIIDSMAMVLKYPYLLGIFGVVSFFEIVVTIFDYRFKTIASAFMSKDPLTEYLGWYGVLVNLVAFTALVGGIGNIGRRLGLKVSLSMLPVIVGGAAVIMYNPDAFGNALGMANPTLTTALAVMVFAKAINYALNQPSKEQLYIPTTHEAKYKSKAFMEMFGSRGSKGLGSLFNGAAEWLESAFKVSGLFALASTGVALGISGVWFLVALYLGNKHKEAVDKNEVVC